MGNVGQKLEPCVLNRALHLSSYRFDPCFINFKLINDIFSFCCSKGQAPFLLIQNIPSYV